MMRLPFKSEVMIEHGGGHQVPEVHHEKALPPGDTHRLMVGPVQTSL
jgi:hypothetical protein